MTISTGDRHRQARHTIQNGQVNLPQMGQQRETRSRRAAFKPGAAHGKRCCPQAFPEEPIIKLMGAPDERHPEKASILANATAGRADYQ